MFLTRIIGLPFWKRRRFWKPWFRHWTNTRVLLLYIVCTKSNSLLPVLTTKLFVDHSLLATWVCPETPAQSTKIPLVRLPNGKTCEYGILIQSKLCCLLQGAFITCQTYWNQCPNQSHILLITFIKYCQLLQTPFITFETYWSSARTKSYLIVTSYTSAIPKAMALGFYKELTESCASVESNNASLWCNGEHANLTARDPSSNLGEDSEICWRQSGRAACLLALPKRLNFELRHVHPKRTDFHRT